MAFLQRKHGDPTQNVEQSINHLLGALEVYKSEESPEEWADVNQNLGNSYQKRHGGDSAEDLERAIAHVNKALSIYVRERYPVDWAGCQNNLGIVYANRVHGDVAENLETAIACFELALEVRERSRYPVDWATTQFNFGLAYRDRVRGDRSDNIERAIAALTSSCEVRTYEGMRRDWADVQNSLGIAYIDRVRGDRADNVERGIECLTASRKVFQEFGLARGVATVESNLGNGYIQRAVGDRTGNLERAIAYLEHALTVLSPAEQPILWADATCNLGLAYVNLKSGDRAENVERAYTCFQDALEFLGRDPMLPGWAIAQVNLGIALVERRRGDRDDNLRQAIEAFRAALEVYTPRTRPHECRRAARNLGHACMLAERWEDASRAYEKAVEANEVLYQASVLLSAREGELAETSELHVNAADALARVGKHREAVTILELGRARGIGEVLARDWSDLDTLRKLDPVAHEEYAQAANQLRLVEAREWAGAVATPAGIGGPAGRTAAERSQRAAEERLRHDMQTAKGRFDNVVQRIRTLDPGFERFLLPPDFDDVAKAVTPDTPLTYLAVSLAGSLTLVVHRPAPDRSGPASDQGGGALVQRVKPPPGVPPVTATVLEGLLVKIDGDRVVGGYFPAQQASRAAFDAALTELLPVLGEAMTGPLAARLRHLGAERVALVACGRLGSLPLHAAGYRHGETALCLLDEVDVSYAPSARVLDAARQARRTQQASRAEKGSGRKLVGVGNPQPTRSPSLEFATAELAAVATLFTRRDPRDQAHPLHETDATKPELLNHAAAATHVHLSCHGRFHPTQPLRSGLELGGGEVLTLQEILAARRFSSARLVVASACQTALSDFLRLPDEVIGLPAGFLQAGVPGVVGTLWSVNDLSTALLLTRFYEYYLRGRDGDEASETALSPAHALRLAQRWLAKVTARELSQYTGQHPHLVAAMKQKRARRSGVSGRASVPAAATNPPDTDGHDDRPFEDPYYWAPFVFVGV